MSASTPTPTSSSTPQPTQQPWLPPSHLRTRDDPSSPQLFNGLDQSGSRSRASQLWSDHGSVQSPANMPADADGPGEHDPRLEAFREMYARSEANIAALFTAQDRDAPTKQPLAGQSAQEPRQENSSDQPMPDAAPKKPARQMDEDDYDDYDDEEDDAAAIGIDDGSPLKSKGPRPPPGLISTTTTPVKTSALPAKQTPDPQKATASQEQGKTSEEVRKQLAQDKKAAEDAAKRSFHTLFYTLENDRDAMLEQQKLEELDRQVDAEMSSHGNQNSNSANQASGTEHQGRLSSANLGASSLTLKHLIARIDTKRDQVRASDAELRSLMSEVRKNRSKWANEDRVGQEELYESAEKVLSELKAMTEHSTAFLTRVNKRDAPDYYNSMTSSLPAPHAS